MASREKRRGVSLHPEDAIDAGLWMGGEAVIEEALFTEYDYGGTVRSRTLPVVLLVTYRHAEGTYEQPYSCGDGWEVEKGGDILIPTKGQKGLPKSSNAYQFFSSLEKAGYDLSDLDETVHAFEGQGVACSRQAQPDRQGFGTDRRSHRDKKGEGREDVKSYILIDDLLDKAPKFGKTDAKGKKTTRRDEDDEDEKPTRGQGRPRDDENEDEKPSRKTRGTRDDEDDEKPTRGKKGRDEDEDEADDDLAEEAEDALVEVLEKAKNTTLKAADVEETVYTHLKGHPKRKPIAELAGDEDFLAGLKKIVKYDGKTVVLK